VVFVQPANEDRTSIADNAIEATISVEPVLFT